MIPKSAANRFANVMGVDLHIAQQEVVLLYALDALAVAGALEKLVFKGGTYLRMMVTGDVGRLSEDLDFTNTGLDRDPEPQLSAALANPHHKVRFRIKDPYRTSRENWGSSVLYSHEWDEGQFRLEISYRETPFLARGVELPFPSCTSLHFPSFLRKFPAFESSSPSRKS